ncbi:MAG TPA: hypothetical protein VGG48_19620 [Rhizomicrobium sp.]|jgi:hypothetical protein
MDRRKFLTAGLTAGAALSLLESGARPAFAAGKCVSVAYGGMCTSEIAFARVVREFDYSQQQDRWGWAAAISMIFAFYGFKIGQEAIVDHAYGSSFDLTGDFVENTHMLNRPWVDEKGRQFDCQVRPLFAVAPDAQNTATAAMIAALDRGQPVLLCDAHHAMVLTSLTYASDPIAPRVSRAVVADPWPDHDHVHTLEPVDLTAPPVGRLHLAAVVEVFSDKR